MFDTDPREMYKRALSHTADVVHTVRIAQLDFPTPCTEFTVRDLLSHIVGGVDRFAHMGRGGSSDEVEPLVHGVADGDWAQALEAAGKKAVDAWHTDERLEAEVSAPWGPSPGKFVVAGYAQELVAHAWDLAKATGQHLDCEPELAAFCLQVAQIALPAERRGGPIPYQVAMDPDPEASDYDRLAAWLGRTV